MVMSLPEEQIEELLRMYPGARQATDGGVTYFLLPELVLPISCSPERVDALLCPTRRDGYESRLFFAQIVQGGTSRNWNAQGIARILDKNWYAISWQTRPGLRLAQMVSV